MFVLIVAGTQDRPIQRRLHSSRFASNKNFLLSHLKAHIDKVLPILTTLFSLLNDPHNSYRFLMGSDLKIVQFALWYAFGIANFEQMFFRCLYSDKLYSLATVKVHPYNVLIISEEMLNYLDVIVLGWNRKRFDGLCLTFYVLAEIALKNVIVGCQRKYVLLEKSKHHALYAVVFLCRQFTTIVKLAVHSLAPAQTSERFSCVKEAS